MLGWSSPTTLYRSHPDLPEGQLAKLRAAVVNMRALAGVARALGPTASARYLLLGRGEEATGGRDKASILADTLEALHRRGLPRARPGRRRPASCTGCSTR